MTTTTNRAVVLAAGTGSRLRAGGNQTPKPLRKVGGTPLLVRVLTTLRTAGIEEAVIVTGYEGEALQKQLSAQAPEGLELIFVHNPRFESKNGVSVLAAAEYVVEGCLLTMSDHLYSPELVRRLMEHELPEGACCLAVDTDIPRCFDLDDATKVFAEGGKIRKIGKELPDYNCLDTGVFRISPALLTELALVDAQTGDCSLSDGVQALSRRGQFHVADVGDALWVDVDTPDALVQAESLLRVYGEDLAGVPRSFGPGALRPDSLELFAPTWVRAAAPYNEDHFAVADQDDGLARMMSNESPFAPSARVVQAIVDAATRGHLYPGGSPAQLRAKLGASVGLGAGNVLLGAGSTELIDVVIRAFVAPGEEVLLSVPTFSMYEARTRVVGGVPLLVPMTHGCEHDVPALFRAITDRTKVIFLCTPNNPTGTHIDGGELRRILDLGIPTVIDEAYFELSDAESNVGLLDRYPNAIVLRTFSKAHGLAGMRVGYLFAHEAAVKLLQRVKVPWNLSSVAIAAASAALDDQEEFRSRMSILRSERTRIAEGLSNLPGVEVVAAEGNFVLLDVASLRISAQEFVAQLLREKVLIRALGAHHAGRSFIRITVAAESDNTRCLKAFERVVARQWARPAAGRAVAGVADAE
jgi:histidinol-phosphate aminotransferase